jgi:hypothetical protein
MTNWFFDKGTEVIQWGENIFSTKGLGIIGHLYEKQKEPQLLCHTQKKTYVQELKL